MTTQRTVNGIPILDFHVHFQPNYGILGPHEKRPVDDAQAARNAAVAAVSAQWRRTFDFPDPEREAPGSIEDEVDRWVAETDRHQIERVVFVTAGGNERGRQLARLHPDRFLVFGTSADPFDPEQIDDLERGFSEGTFAGIKLLAPDLPYRIDDPRGDRLWDVLARYQRPALIHFGHLGSAGGISYNDRIEPKHLDAVAKAHPDVNFVIPHFGVQYVQQVLFLSWGNPNVYTDTSGSNQWIQWLPYDSSLKDIQRRFYETVGPDHLIFGSDSSWFPRGFAYRYLSDQQRNAFELGWPEEHLRAYFGGNAARLLGIDW